MVLWWLEIRTSWWLGNHFRDLLNSPKCLKTQAADHERLSKYHNPICEPSTSVLNIRSCQPFVYYQDQLIINYWSVNSLNFLGLSLRAYRDYPHLPVIVFNPKFKSFTCRDLHDFRQLTSAAMHRLVFGLTAGHDDKLAVQGHGAGVTVPAVLQVVPLVPLAFLPIEKPNFGHEIVVFCHSADQ